MRITASKNELLSRFQTTGRIISNKASMPIMAYFLCEVKEGRIFISAADSIGRMDTSMECSADKEGKFCIESKKIIEALKKLPEQPIVLEINEENYAISIQYSGGHFEMIGSDPGLFPEIRKIENPLDLKIDSKIFLKGISDAIFCAADDELRPVMNGVYIEAENDGINFVATDGHRMAMIHNDAECFSRQSFIVPTKVASILKGFDKKANCEMSVSVGSQHAMFEIGDYKITAILVEGRYPNYRSVIPENDRKMIVQTSSLKDAISRVGLFANPSSMLVIFSLSKDTLELKAQDIDYSSSAKETIPCEYDSKKLEIGMKSNLLYDILSHIDSEQVMFLFSEPDRAILIEPVDKQPGESAMYLQMPCIIN